jgi:hypothetical protein
MGSIPVGATKNRLTQKLSKKGTTIESNAKGYQNKSRYISKHNERGLLTETLDYRNDSLAVKQIYWYEYDRIGNWTKRYNSYNGNSPSLIIREIAYY